MNEQVTAEVVVHQGSQLAIQRDQPDWSLAQYEALVAMFNLASVPVPTLQAYFHTCQSTGLDPFKRQIYLIERKGKFTPQTSIDGFRIIRDRSGVYDGDETEWCGDDNVWSDAWLGDGFPKAARVKLYVKGRKMPVVATALWSEYVQTKGDGGITQMWATKSSHMLAKVAEALAIRKAFPDDTGGLYTDDEMMQATNGEPEQPARRKGSPGIMDLDTPPEPARQQYGAPADPGVGGGFMDAPPAPADPQPERVYPVQPEGEDVQDAEVVPEQLAAAPPAPEQPAEAPPAPPAPAAPTEEPQGDMMNMQPEAREELPHTWARHLAEFCELEQPMMHQLEAMYNAAAAEGALEEPVPWFKNGASFHEAVMFVRANLEQGQPVLHGAP